MRKQCQEHIGARRTKDGRCVSCESLRRAEYRARNLEREQSRRLAYRERERELDKQRRLDKPELGRARTRRWRERHPEAVKEANKAAYHANIDHHKARAKEWRKANPDKAREKANAWRRANPERAAEIRSASIKRWRAKYPERAAAAIRLYQAQKRKALPKWADRNAMRAIYAEARRLTKETGVEHHVDHIIPINSPVVCGLHVEANLQVIPAVENARKGNRLPTALAA